MYRIFHVKLMDRATGKAVSTAGGTAYVATAGDAAKATLYDPDNGFATLANPLTPTRGALRFATLETVLAVDLYVMAPDGQFVVQRDVNSGVADLWVDTHLAQQVAQIPFAIGDTAAATETDTGFDFPVNAIIHTAGIGVRTTTADATETIDAGILTGETGADPDGFLDGVSVATAVMAKPTLASGGQTLGALLRVDEGGTGELVPEAHVVVSGGQSLSYTLSAGTDTAEGVIVLPYTLPAI